MAIELGSNFPQRWQRSTVDFRQYVFDELQDVCRFLGGQMYERVVASQARPVLPIPPSVFPVSSVEQELKKSFLQNADDLIEQHLDTVRQDLRKWLHGEMNRLLADSLKKPE